MKLIKCNHCGRPFYNDATECPYCGHAAHLSANNFVTRPITNPQSHKLMEDVLSGNYHPTKPSTPQLEPTPVHKMPEIICEDVAVNNEPEQISEVTDIPNEPSEALKERAEVMSNIAQNTVETTPVDDEIPVDDVETEHVPHKRRGWIWIIIIILILGAAAAVYLKWDFIYDKITSLLS